MQFYFVDLLCGPLFVTILVHVHKSSQWGDSTGTSQAVIVLILCKQFSSVIAICISRQLIFYCILLLLLRVLKCTMDNKKFETICYKIL